eukprot:TRINITY_DN4505_c0_g1_i3.p1 TRINITY_DN4505_c0_g1~~TRINITY_DN4505_c0_g1_i3.p1  ORF type:complete len:2997 (+),score=642.49 TRINITY_DN4505_c0_g1_i3:1212-10202(+)
MRKDTAEDLFVLDCLEQQLCFEDIVFFRSLSLMQIRKQEMLCTYAEAANPVLPAAPASASAPAAPTGGSWWNKLWYGSSASAEEAPPTQQSGVAGASSVVLTSEQRAELLGVLGFCDSAAARQDEVAASLVQLSASVRLDQLTLALRDEHTGATSARLSFSAAGITYTRKQGRFELAATVGRVCMEDLEAAGSGGELFTQLVAPRLGEAGADSEGCTPHAEDNKDTFCLTVKSGGGTENNAADTDYTVEAKLMPLDVVISPVAVQRVVRFFKKPDYVNVDMVWDDVNKWISSNTAIHWRDVLESHLRINFHLDLQSPLIAVPQTNAPNTPLLLLDFGRLSIQSDLRPREEIVNLAECYDHYMVAAERMNARVVHAAGADWRRHLHNPDYSEPLVPRFDLRFHVAHFMLPACAECPVLRVAGELPELHVNLSDGALAELLLIAHALPVSRGLSAPSEQLASAAELDVLLADEERRRPGEQWLLEGSFVVHKVVGSLRAEGKDLITATASLNATYVHRHATQVASFAMQSVFAYDHWVQSADTKVHELASSGDRQLFSVNVTLAQNQQPNVSVQAATLSLQLHLPTVTQLMKFFDIGLDPGEGPAVYERESNPQFHVSANLQQLAVTVNSSHSAVPLAQLVVSDVLVDCDVRKRTLRARGALGGVVVRDLTAQGARYREACCSLLPVRFDLRVFSEQERLYPGYDMSLRAEMGAARFVYLNRFVALLLDLLDEFTLRRAGAIEQLRNIRPKKESRLNLDLQVRDLELVVPRDSYSSSCFVAQLGRVSITNSFLDELEDRQILVYNTRVSSGACKESRGTPNEACAAETALLLPELRCQDTVAHDVDTIEIHYKAPYLKFRDKYPQMELTVSIPPIAATLDYDQYDSAVGLLFGNLDERCDIAGQTPSPAEAAPWRRFSFDMKLLTVSLRGTDTAGPFVYVSFQNMSYEYTPRGSMQAMVASIRGIRIKDLTQIPGQELETLVTYENPQANVGQQQADLLRVFLTRELQGGQANIHNLSVVFNQLYVCLNRETVWELCKFFVPKPETQRQLSGPQAAPAPGTTPSYKFKVTLCELTVWLVSRGRRFSEVKFSNGTVQLDYKQNSTTASSGKLGAVSVKTVGADADRILSFDDVAQQAVQFRVSYAPGALDLWLRTSDGMAHYEPRFFSQLSDYATELWLFLGIALSGTEKAIEAAAAPLELKVDAEIRAPRVVFREARGLRREIALHIGTCAVHDECGGSLRVSLRDSALIVYTAPDNAGRNVLDRIDIDVVLERRPALRLAVCLPSLSVALAKTEYDAIVSVLRDLPGEPDAPLQSGGGTPDGVGTTIDYARVHSVKSAPLEWGYSLQVKRLSVCLKGTANVSISDMTIEAGSTARLLSVTAGVGSLVVESGLTPSGILQKRLVDSAAPQHSRQLLIVQYEHGTNSDLHHVRAALCKPRIFVLPQLLRALLDFVRPEPVAVTAASKSGEITQWLHEQYNKAEVPRQQTLAFVQRSTFELALTAEEPELFAFEDANLATSAVVVSRFKSFQTKATLSLGSTFESLTDLDDFEVLSYTLNRPNETLAPVLQPFNVHLLADKKGDAVTLSFSASSVTCVLTYNLWLAAAVALRVSDLFGGGDDAPRAAEATAAEAEPQAPHLLAVAYAEDKNDADAAACGPPLSSLLTGLRLQATASIPRVSLCLVDDSRGVTVPLVEVAVSSLVLHSEGNFARNSVQFAVECRSFNASTSWEPVLDPVQCNLSLLFQPHAQLSFRPAGTVNVTLSAAFVAALVLLYRTWECDFGDTCAGSRRAAVAAVSVSRTCTCFRIVNETGQSVIANLEGGGSEGTTVSVGQSAFVVASGDGARAMMRFDVGNCGETALVPVGRLQRLCATLSRACTSLLVDVALEPGGKVVSLRSCVRLKNVSATPADFFVAPDSGEGGIVVENLAPKSYAALPLPYATTCCVSVRPSGCGFGWTQRCSASLLLSSGPVCVSSSNPDCGCASYQLALKPEARVRPISGIPGTAAADLLVLKVCAPFQVRCLLPFRAEFVLTDSRGSRLTGDVDPGKTAQIHTLGASVGNVFLSLRLAEHPFLGNTWSDNALVCTSTTDSRGVPLCSPHVVFRSTLGTLLLPLDCSPSKRQQCWRVTVQCRLWGTNQTTLPLDLPDYALPPTDAAPVLYAGRGSWRIRISGLSNWSGCVELATPGTRSIVTVPGARPGESYELALAVHDAGRQFRGSAMFRLAPRFRLANALRTPLQFASRGVRLGEVAPGQVVPLYCLQERQLQISVLGLEWSAPFSLEILDDFPIRMHSKQGKLAYIANVSITATGAEVTITASSCSVPPFVIENHTHLTVTVGQKDCSAFAEVLPPKHCVNFAWDYPAQERMLQLGTTALDIAKLGRTELCVGPYDVDAIVKPRGSTRVVQLFDRRHDRQKDRPEVPYLSIEMKLDALGVSVVDMKPRELLYLSLVGVSCEYNRTNLHANFLGVVKDLQVDNQMYSTLFPVLAFPTSHAKKNIRDGTPVIHVSIVQSTAFPGAHCFELISFLLGELEVKAEENIVNRLWFLYKYVSDQLARASQPSPKRQKVQSANARVYVDILVLNPIAVNLTYQPSAGGASSDNGSRERQLGFLHIGSMLACNIDRAALHFPELVAEKSFCTLQQLLDRCGEHYYEQLAKVLLVLAGSVGVLGNPAGLVSNVRAGFHDLKHERDIGRGAMSLAQHTLVGTLGVAGSWASAASTGIGAIAMDKSFNDHKHKHMAAKPSSAAAGLYEGGRALSSGILSGFTGLVTQPVAAAKTGSKRAMFKGVIGGALGLAAKPVSGALEFAASTTSGLKAAAEGMADGTAIARVRLPREVAADGTLPNYEEHRAVGQWLTYCAKVARKDTHDGMRYMDHVTCEKGGRSLSLLLTERHILFMAHGPYEPPALKWAALLTEISFLSLDNAQGVFVARGRQYAFEWSTQVGRIKALLDRNGVRFNATACPPTLQVAATTAAAAPNAWQQRLVEEQMRKQQRNLLPW